MISRRVFAGMLVGVALVATSGCGPSKSQRFHFRLAIEVETPQGIRRASGVYMVWAKPSLPGATSRLWGEEGEAVAVDLPNGQTLFSLLKTGAMHGDIASLSMATLDEEFNNTMVESAERLSGRYSDVVPVARENYPMLVTFKDINEPSSVVLVDPDDLAASFGKGYKLKAITAELTSDPVTTGIEKRLNALGLQADQGLDRTSGVTPNPTLAQQLGYIDFVRR